MVNDLLDLGKHHAKAQKAQRIHTEGVLAFFASWREPFRLSTTFLTSTDMGSIRPYDVMRGAQAVARGARTHNT